MECCGKDEAKITHNNHGDEEDEHCSYALQLWSMCVMPMVMKAAVDLDLLEIISKAGPGAQLSPAEIAGQMPTQNPDAPAIVDRILRLLSSYSVVTCSVDNCAHPGSRSSRVYGLAPVAKYYVRNQDGASFGPLIALIQDKVFMDSCSSWQPERSPARTGLWAKDEWIGNCNVVHTVRAHMFEILGVVSVDCKEESEVDGPVVHRAWRGFGCYHPLTSLTYLVHVLWGVEHVGGDMFVNVPKADAIFMKWIIHDWSNDHCLKLLKNCYKALPDDGKVIVVESILPVIPNTSAGVKHICQSDLAMLTLNPGGKERTEQEFLDLATGAGFSGIRLECFACNFWVIEFYK